MFIYMYWELAIPANIISLHNNPMHAAIATGKAINNT
jgi:hypothetical protein